MRFLHGWELHLEFYCCSRSWDCSEELYWGESKMPVSRMFSVANAGKGSESVSCSVVSNSSQSHKLESTGSPVLQAKSLLTLWATREGASRMLKCLPAPFLLVQHGFSDIKVEDTAKGHIVLLQEAETLIQIEEDSTHIICDDDEVLRVRLRDLVLKFLQKFWGEGPCHLHIPGPLRPPLQLPAPSRGREDLQLGGLGGGGLWLKDQRSGFWDTFSGATARTSQSGFSALFGDRALPLNFRRVSFPGLRSQAGKATGWGGVRVTAALRRVGGGRNVKDDVWPICHSFTGLRQSN